MSLLHLVHKNILLKFADGARNQFNPELSYAFRLTGVDAMGFIQIQDLKSNHPAAPETTSEPYWINKDLVREIREVDLATTKEAVQYTGKNPEPEPESVKPQPEATTEPVEREGGAKILKAKSSSKSKTALKQKPAFN